MNDEIKATSRRAVLNLGTRALAGAGILATLEQFSARVARAGSAPSNRSLVCIYMFGGEGGEGLIAPSDLPAARSYPAMQDGFLPVVDRITQKKYGLNSAAPELQALYETSALAAVMSVVPAANSPSAITPSQITAQRYAALRFLPNGFATPSWAATMTGIRSPHGDGAFTFDSGMSVVSPGASSREGDQFENHGLRQAMNRAKPLQSSFPNTPLGRQLLDVSRLLETGHGAGMNQVIFLCTAGGYTRSARLGGTISARYQELSQAMAAFYAATVELGLEQQVTTFTDAESGATQANEVSLGARVILGGSVLGGDVYSNGIPGSDNYLGSIARWFGLSPDLIGELFPGYQAPGIQMLT
jgi:hypothetical protein